MSNQSVSWRRVAIAVTVASFVVGAAGGRAQDVEKPWDRSMAVGFSLSEGNSQSLLFNAGAKAEKIWKADELRLGIDGAYGVTSRDNTPGPGNPDSAETSTETLRGLIDYKHLFNERLYGGVNVTAEHDGLASLEYRFTVGPLVGYYVIKSESTRLSFFGGPALVIEKSDQTHPNQAAPNTIQSDQITYLALHLGERFEHKFGDKGKIWQQTDYYPRFDDFVDDYIVVTEIGAEAALNKSLSVRVVGTHRYDSIVAAGIHHHDLTLVSALAYKF